MNKSGRLVCTVCTTYYTDTLANLSQHMRLFHAHQPRLSIRCGIGGFDRSFKNFGTYQNYISGYNRSESNPTNVSKAEDSDDHEIADISETGEKFEEFEGPLSSFHCI